MARETGSDLTEKLTPEGAQDVLRRLLVARPDLRPEVEQVVGEMFAAASFEKVADGVEAALRSITMDAMVGRSGRHAGGYTEPKEAALELMEQAVQPFLGDMLRRRELDRDTEALEICKGVVLGLYRMRGKMGGHDVLQWCPDFPSGHAWWAFNLWSEESVQGRGDRRSVTRKRWLAREFVEKFVPEWDGMAEPAGSGR